MASHDFKSISSPDLSQAPDSHMQLSVGLHLEA